MGIRSGLLMFDNDFWHDKSVFITGHTGFKGAWLSLWLTSLGAKVTGYSLSPITSPSLFEILPLQPLLHNSVIADIRDSGSLKDAFNLANPQVVFHLAAQPLVRFSYENPLETYHINILGTANLLDCLRNSDAIEAAVIVTSDKCYENKEWDWGYRESDGLGGHDPYSSSKACAEIVTEAYRKSFFSNSPKGRVKLGIATARAGNVIGGGDWSRDRLVPDLISAIETSNQLMIRNPRAVRPWQYVLEPLSGYILLAEKLASQPAKYSGPWNFGPGDDGFVSVERMVELFSMQHKGMLDWGFDAAEHPHETSILRLDCSKSKAQLGWRSRWDIERSIDEVSAWCSAYWDKQDMIKFSLRQIERYSVDGAKE